MAGELYQGKSPSTSSSHHSIYEAADALMANIEGYYGFEYNSLQRDVIRAYLCELKPEVISKIYGELLKVKLFAAKLPLVEHLEEARKATEEKIRLSAPPSPYDPHRLLSVETFESDLSPEEVRRRINARAPWLRGVIGGGKAAGE